MKRVLVLLSSILMFGGVLAGCSSNKADNSVKTIQNKKTLVVGTAADYAPFEFPIVQNGQKKIAEY